MALTNFCRGCLCGTREDSSDDETHSQSQHSEPHDPNSCPLLASHEPSIASESARSQHSGSYPGSLSSLLDSAPSVRAYGGTGNGRPGTPIPSRGNGTSNINALTDAHRDPAIPEEKARDRGREMIAWIEDPTANDPPCPISPSTLTFEQLKQACVIIKRDEKLLPEDLKYPPGVQAPATYIHWSLAIGKDSYALFFAPGVIDIAIALYRHEFGDIDSLKHIFPYGVVNPQTVSFLDQDLEDRSYAQFDGPNKIKDFMYMRGTLEYTGLLGTRIPRTVGYLVLGAFPRGTRRISGAEVYGIYGYCFDLRFDIE